MRYIVYSTNTCSYCKQATELLKEKGLPFDVYYVDAAPVLLEELRAKVPNVMTVPQIFQQTETGEIHIGGYKDLLAALTSTTE